MSYILGVVVGDSPRLSVEEGTQRAVRHICGLIMGAGRVVSGPCCLHVPCQLIFSVIISSSTVISFLVFSTRQMMKKSAERMVTKSTMF